MQFTQKLLIPGFLGDSMLAMGLNLTLLDILAPLRDLRLVLIAPAFVWFLTVVIPRQRGHATGLLLLVSAIVGPVVSFSEARWVRCGGMVLPK